MLNADGNVTERELTAPGAKFWPRKTPRDAVSWLFADNEGTVRDVAVLSGGETTFADHLVYDAFGNITSQTHPDAQPRFTYTGQQLDAATKLYDDGARWYDAAMGSFSSQDPAGFSAGDANFTATAATTR